LSNGLKKYAPKSEKTVVQPKTEIEKLVSHSPLKSSPLPNIPAGSKIQNLVKDDKQPLVSDDVEFMKREFVHIRSRINNIEQSIRQLRGEDIKEHETPKKKKETEDVSKKTESSQPKVSPSKQVKTHSFVDFFKNNMFTFIVFFMISSIVVALFMTIKKTFYPKVGKTN